MRILIPLLAGMVLSASAQSPRMPMRADFAESATYRWLQKDVLERRALDSADALEHWKTTGQAEMSLTKERSRDGGSSVRLLFHTRTPQDAPPPGKRNYGAAGILRQFPGEDWTRFNRVSFWVYPDFPGWRVSILRVFLHNDGAVKVPGGFYPVYHCAVLKNHSWNQVVWEFPDVPRDKVTGIEIQCRRQGSEPEAATRLTLDVDQLELQRVEADMFEGWNVWPGRVAFSHTGYRPQSRKTALAGAPGPESFSIVSQGTGQTVLSKPAARIKTLTGEYHLLDFSELREPGAYAIKTGGAVTRPFRIARDVWDATIWKAINFFFAERCGYDVPGSHRVCHRDWQGVSGGQRIIINGGWHDAGDLSQGLVNTSEAVYAMFDLADALRRRGGDPALYRRLLEEAKWGLDWVLKTSFGDGNRIVWATMGMWTDGILGNNDDVTADAQNSPNENFLASASEAIAARVLEGEDPELAAYSLKKAREDWRFAVAGMEEKRVRGALIETASSGVLASLELLAATGEAPYGAKAQELARILLDSQQRQFAEGLDQPLTGFFYRDPAKQALLHYIHRGHEQAPVVALARLCGAFPEHHDWMKWYSAVVLHSEFFQKRMAQFTEPYRMLPNSIHKTDEHLQISEPARENHRQQVLNGVQVGRDYYVRVYPVQPAGTFRGNYGTMLSQAKAISTAARLRGDAGLELLAEEQLQWIVGRNPFAQSTMYGEGYDFGPQYSAMSGDIVGALPVGIKSRENFDVPYWPVHNHPNYREVWVHPVSRWLWVLADLVRSGAAPGGQPGFSVSHSATPEGQVVIRLRAGQPGGFTLRSDNLVIEGSPERRAAAGAEIVWKARVADRKAPWVAVAFRTGRIDERKEIFGWLQ